MKYNEIIDHLHERRDNLLTGKVNCIPSPFKRFTRDFVGVEQGKYYSCSANTKVGKTQVANFIFVYSTVWYAFCNQDKVRLKIMYFNLEENEENITLRFISHLLYRYSLGKFRKDIKALKSTRSWAPIDSEVLDALEDDPYKSVMEFYDKVVEFRAERNPIGITKAIESFCKENGTIKTKKMEITNDFGQKQEVDVFESYEPNDKELYFIPIIDHIGLVMPESGNSLKQAIDLLSGNLVKLRNRYNCSPVVIIQQAASQESLESFKAKKMRPSVAGIGDSKACARDMDLLFGLYSPFRHEEPNFNVYDITRFKDHFRVLEVLLNREGEANSMVPLWFDGATNSFAELPQPPWAKGQKQPGMNCSNCTNCSYANACDLRQWYERSEEYNQINNLVILEWKRRINRRWWYALVSPLRERWMRKKCAKESCATSTRRNTVYLTVI